MLRAEPFGETFDDHVLDELPDEEDNVLIDDDEEPDFDERLEEGFWLLSLSEDDDCSDEDEW